MSPDIRGIASGMKILGPAVTVKVPPGDNLMIHKALTLAKRGDVLVIDGGGFTSIALLGFIIAQTAKKVGISGFVVDGSIRDVSGIKGTGLGVFARGISLNGPSKKDPRSISYLPWRKIVHPGDTSSGMRTVYIIPKDSAAQALSDSKDLIVRRLPD
jgi:regulator of RNase E activity RraA